MLDEATTPANLPAIANDTPASVTMDLAFIALGQITPDPNQPRREFDKEYLEQLAASIRAQGVVQPIVVRPSPAGADGTAHVCPHQIIAGEQRWRAAALAGLDVIPAVIRIGLTDSQVRAIQLIENINRKDLSLGEKSMAIAAHVAEFGVAETMKQTSQNEVWVSRMAGIRELPEPVLQLVGDNILQSSEIAHMLGKIFKLDKQKAEYRISEFRTASKHGYAPPTRKQLREILQSAEAAHKAKEKQKLEKKLLKEKAKADPKVQKAFALEQQKEKDRKGIRERQAHAKKYCGELAHKLTEELSVLAGFKRPKRSDYGYAHHIPLAVSPPHINDYGTDEPPKTAQAGTYGVLVRGEIEAIEKGAKLLDPNPKLRLDFHGEMTLSEARGVAKVLGRKATFRFSVTGKGSALEKMLEASPPPAKETKKVDAPSGAGGITEFIAAAVAKGSGDVTAADFYAAYCKWAKGKGLVALALRDNKYAAAIAAAGIKKKRLETGFVYLSIKLGAAK